MVHARFTGREMVREFHGIVWLGNRLNSVDSTEFSLLETGQYVIVPNFGDLTLFGRVPQ